MSESSESLHHRISGAEDLRSIVRTMKALSATQIAQYERAVQAVDVYANTVELGLIACLRQQGVSLSHKTSHKRTRNTGVIIFGSDQGLIGQFNDVLAQSFVQKSAHFSGDLHVWVIGERMSDQLTEFEIPIVEIFKVPNSIHAITQLVEQLLLAAESEFINNDISELHLFYNGNTIDINGYSMESQRILPLDEKWHKRLSKRQWQTNNLPDTMGQAQATLKKLISEYLFVSLFRACAESLASENASRLATMQRAEKNISDMLDDLTHSYHQLRQESIDNELFDVVASFNPS